MTAISAYMTEHWRLMSEENKQTLLRERAAIRKAQLEQLERGQEPYRADTSRHHATKKTPAQLDREIAEWQASRSGLSKHQRDLLSRRKPGGGLGAGYLTPAGWHGDPMAIEDRKLRLEALREQPAPRFPKEPARRTSHATKAGRKSTRDRIIDQIAKHAGVTSIGLVASDLRLSHETVKRYVNALIREGIVQYGWDGNALELTDAAHRERAIDARVASHR